MGIDWENILGDRVDLTDAYDNLGDDSKGRIFGDNIIPPDFDGNMWYKDATGTEAATDQNEYIAAAFSCEQYVNFLRDNHNDLPGSELGKAFAFFMTEQGGRIIYADHRQRECACKGSAEEYIYDSEYGLAAQIKNAQLSKEETTVKSGSNREVVDTILDVFKTFLKHDDFYDEAFLAVYHFLERGEYDYYTVDDMDAVFDALDSVDYHDVDWDYFSEKEHTLSHKRKEWV